MPAPAEPFSEIRWSILSFLKREGSGTITAVARALGVTYEAVRVQFVQLERDGWISKRLARSARPGGGRPTGSYALTTAGEHLFPKHYDLLAVELLDRMADQLEPEALTRVLAALTQARVARWEPLLRGRPLAERVAALKGLYLDDDPHMTVQEKDGVYSLVERNCPFLNVALQRPALCSVTMNTLERLLGMRVVRDERFQSGDGRCVFRIVVGEPVAPAEFRYEGESKTAQADVGVRQASARQ
jgi:predicted ArsR family transcriptional regulator